MRSEADPDASMPAQHALAPIVASSACPHFARSPRCDVACRHAASASNFYVTAKGIYADANAASRLAIQPRFLSSPTKLASKLLRASA